MEVEILKRLKTELESFRLLNNAYLVGAASMIAYSTAYILIIIIPTITNISFNYEYLPFLIILICILSTAFIGINRNAELMNKHNKIIIELNQIINNEAQEEIDEFDEHFIGIILKSLAFYRENTSKINRYKWGGRLTGAFLLLTGVPQLFRFIYGSLSINSVYVHAQLVLVILSIVISIVTWYIPVLIERFLETWDSRLELAEEVNEQIRIYLEDTL